MTNGWQQSEVVLVRAVHAIVWSRLRSIGAARPVPSSEELRSELIEAGVGMPQGRIVEIARSEGLPLSDLQVDTSADTRKLKAIGS